MNGKMRSSVMGLILGQFSSPLPMAQTPEQKEPLGYLYGETLEGEYSPLSTYLYGPLPSEKEWDRTEYPYAVVYFAGLFTHMLFVSKEPWYGTGEPYMYTDHNDVTTQFGETIRNESTGLWFTDEMKDDGSRTGFWRLLTDEEIENTAEWLFLNELGQNKDTDGDGKYDYGAMGLINWSNHDIISADRKTVLVAKSEPIPIYE